MTSVPECLPIEERAATAAAGRDMDVDSAVAEALAIQTPPSLAFNEMRSLAQESHAITHPSLWR
jgi:hypothetical protein